MTQIEQEAHVDASKEEREGDTDCTKQEVGEEDGEEVQGGEVEYGGGRFAGVGDFEPAVQKTSRRVTLPLFRCKPEAALRYESLSWFSYISVIPALDSQWFPASTTQPERVPLILADTTWTSAIRCNHS